MPQYLIFQKSLGVSGYVLKCERKHKFARRQTQVKQTSGDKSEVPPINFKTVSMKST